MWRPTWFVIALIVIRLSGVAEAQEPVKIGVVQSLTGPLALLGGPVVQGAQAAVERINAAGGVLGRRIELITFDDQSKPSQAVQVAAALATRERVTALIGSTTSASTLAVMPVVAERGIPLVVETSVATAITRSGNPWVFRLAAHPEMLASMSAPLINSVGIRRAELLAADYAFGRELVTAFTEALTRNGISIGTPSFTPLGTRDFTPWLAKLGSTTADTLILGVFGNDLRTVLVQAKELGLQRKLKVLGLGGIGSVEDVIASAGDAADGSYHLVHFLSSLPDVMANAQLVRGFLREWSRRGQPIERAGYGARGFDAITTIAEAIRLAGVTEPQAVRDALWRVDLAALHGRVRFQKDGPAGTESGQNRPGVYLVQIKNGKVTLPTDVRPSTVAVAPQTEPSPRPSPTATAAIPVAPPASPPPVPSAGLPATTAFGRYHALVIGNQTYRSLPRLTTPIADARAVADLLSRDYGFHGVQLLTDATRTDIVRALDDLRRRMGTSDNLLIYYAGHGWLDREADRGYWLPVDAEPDSRTNWLSNADITDTVRALKAKHVVVVADSCYAGTLTRDIGIRALDAADLSRLAQKRARTALTSGGLEPVADTGGAGYSVFARAFIDTLKENRGMVDLTSLFAAVRRRVLLHAEQTPQYSDIRQAGHDGGDFIFVRSR